MKYTTKDGKCEVNYAIRDLEGCCGGGVATALEIVRFPSKWTAKQRNGYAKEVWDDINYHTYEQDYAIVVISSITERGFHNIEDAYWDDDAPRS